MSFMHTQFNPKKHSKYIPINPEKYIGKYQPIIRSKLEQAFVEIIDKDKNIIEWSSESFYIEYMFQNKKKKYYPDFYIKIKTPLEEQKVIIEIKHSKETLPPIPGKKSRKVILNEQFTWQKNQAKWKAAKKWCEKMGYQFKFITEKQLFKNGNY